MVAMCHDERLASLKPGDPILVPLRTGESVETADGAQPIFALIERPFREFRTGPLGDLRVVVEAAMPNTVETWEFPAHQVRLP